MIDRRTRTRRLAAAVAASGVLVLAAPFVGMARSQLRALFPDQFALIVEGLVGAALCGAVAAGLLRIRANRLPRYAAMTFAVAAAAVYAQWTSSADPAIRAVEHFHFVEYGLITFLFYRVWTDRGDWSSLAMPLVASFIVGTADEAFQWFLPARVGELKDVWLNGVAIVCGLLFSLGAAPPPVFDRGSRPGSRRLVGRALALAVLAVAAFIHAVHLGVEIRDPDAGSFVSRFTAAELAAADRARAAAWAVTPPLVRPARLSREDQFMTEGLQHAQARNRAWSAGDYFVAWRQNLILERYFPAVLDTPSYVAKSGHRWSAEQRRDAETRAEGTQGRPFVSGAYPYPLYLWPAWAVWCLALAAAAGLWFAAAAVT